MDLSVAVKPRPAGTLELSGSRQRLFVALWCVITLASILSLALSIYGLHVWDSVPAVDTPRYYPDMTSDGIQAHAAWQQLVLDAGLSLAGYAWIFTASRLVGGLSLLLVSIALIRRYSGHLMGALMATLLPVLAAAGIWNSSLFAWAAAIAPWMQVPVQVLGWLTWCGAIVVYPFPDGKFTPRWTAVLAMLLVPLTFIRSFDFDIVLNPDKWPGLWYLALDVLVIAAVLIAVLVRHARATDERQPKALGATRIGRIGRRALRWVAAGWVPLVILYFANLLLNDVWYYFAGHVAFEGAAALTFVLVSEPVWYACEAFLAIALAVAIFRGKLLESPEAAGG